MPVESAAVEATVDAYATRVLTEASPPEACVDESLGPYVTSMLRMSDLEQHDDVSKIEDFDSLVELLEEHCAMKQQSDAEAALRLICDAVRTGNVPPPPKQPKLVPNETETVDLLSNALSSADISSRATGTEASSNTIGMTSNGGDLAKPGGSDSSQPATGAATPVDLGSLIPVESMGVIENPSTPSAANNSDKESDKEKSRVKEGLGKEVATETTGKADEAPSRRDESSSREMTGSDLVASLFKDNSRSSRRQESNFEPSSQLQPANTPHLSTAGLAPPSTVDLYPAVEMLLSMTPDLSEEAAMEAARVAQGDINLAQFIIDGAITSPPICRHLLSDHGCYRSDCHFSHDIDDCTCMFWLRPTQCAKGEGECRFRHGFSQKRIEEGRRLLIGMDQQQGQATTNAFPQMMGGMAMPRGMTNNMQWAAATKFGHMGSMMGMAPPPVTQTQASPGMISVGATTLPPSNWNASITMQQPVNPSSFANIASSGYNQSSSFAKAAVMEVPSISSAPHFVRIPQDLWNPSINRNSEAFQIPDPMERYYEVSKSVKREDVIDLHYQSMKTFGIVLSSVLPPKLRQHHREGVWIVTGTGHSVGRSHQKGGGVLEQAVLEWLDQFGYVYRRGKDRNGQTGAVLVQQAPS